jgi:hypothetical protein
MGAWRRMGAGIVPHIPSGTPGTLEVFDKPELAFRRHAGEHGVILASLILADGFGRIDRAGNTDIVGLRSRRIHFLFYPFVRPQRSPSFRADPPLIAAARRDRSRMAVAQAVQRAAAFPGHFLTGQSTAAGSGRVRPVGVSPERAKTRRSEASLPGWCAKRARLVLCSADPIAGSNRDAVMRIGGEAPRRQAHSFPRHRSQGTRTGHCHLGSSGHCISLQSGINAEPVLSSLSCFHQSPFM